ncbi:DUF1836 domain-containing protein [Fredinandcohnia humi]
MKDQDHILQNLDLDRTILLEDIPHIDLYMDQVIQLFENTFGTSKRNDDEKVLTKTMINNYAKGKLLFPIKNKKYSRDHLILLSLIYQLKSSLSISDIKATLEGINKRIVSDNDFSLEEFYKSYLQLYKKNVEEFKTDLDMKMKDVIEEISDRPNDDNEYIKNVLLIISLTASSFFYRRAAETLVDELLTKQNEQKEK